MHSWIWYYACFLMFTLQSSGQRGRPLLTETSVTGALRLCSALIFWIEKINRNFSIRSCRQRAGCPDACLWWSQWRWTAPMEWLWRAHWIYIIIRDQVRQYIVHVIPLLAVNNSTTLLSIRFTDWYSHISIYLRGSCLFLPPIAFNTNNMHSDNNAIFCVDV